MSSATVRNILAELEAAGLLTHPAHLAPGAIPTDAGYRFYVESIVDAAPLPAVEQLMIRHQFGQVQFASEHWFRLAATTLAAVTRSAGLATPAKPRAAHVRRIDLVAHQRAAGEPDPRPPRGRDQAGASSTLDATTVDQEDADAVAAIAQRAACRPRPAAAGRARRDRAGSTPTGPSADLVARVGERVVRVLREYDAAAIEEVFSDGLLNVMDAPEFAQSEKLRRVFAALENRAYLGELVGSVAGTGRVQVFIGHENAPTEMREVSLVLAPVRAARPGRRRRRRARARRGWRIPRPSAPSASCPA